MNTGIPFKGYLFTETNNQNDKISKVEVYDINNNFLELCDNVKAASDKYGVSETSLRLSSYKDKPFKGKYFFVVKL